MRSYKDTRKIAKPSILLQTAYGTVKLTNALTFGIKLSCAWSLTNRIVRRIPLQKHFRIVHCSWRPFPLCVIYSCARSTIAPASRIYAAEKVGPDRTHSHVKERCKNDSATKQRNRVWAWTNVQTDKATTVPSLRMRTKGTQSNLC